MDLSEFVRNGWRDHAGDAEGVMARFTDGIELVAEPGHIPALAALIVHVAGEHLGRWDDGVALLDRLAALPVHDGDSASGRSLARSRAVLGLCKGDPDWESDLARGETGNGVPPESDRIRVHAIAASALAGQKRTDEAVTLFRTALDLADYGPDKGDPASRALAITGNNVACELEDLTERSADEVELMKLAAATARTYWEIAGSWVEVERAEYRLAKTHLAAGEPAVALIHAETCLAVCEENGADPGERFFAHEVLAYANRAAGDDDAARTHRDEAARLAECVGEGLASYCKGELAKLDAQLAAHLAARPDAQGAG